MRPGSGDVGVDPGTGAVIDEEGADSEAGDATGAVGTEPGTRAAIDEADTDPGTSVQEAQAVPFCHTGCSGTSFMAVGVALSVVGIVVTTLVPAVLSVMQAGEQWGQQRPSFYQWV